MDRVWGADRAIAAVTLPGDRRDDLLRESARMIGGRFGRVVLHEDRDRRGRASGEVPGIVRAELTAVRPDVDCTVVDTVEEALGAALKLAGPGDVVLLLYEKIEPVRELLELLGAVSTPDSGALMGAWSTSVTSPAGTG